MIKGSHNSLTYLKPKTFLMRLLGFKYTCQTKSLENQIKTGTHALDINVRFDTNHNIIVTNGKWESKNHYTCNEFISKILDTIKNNRIDDDDILININLDTFDDSYFQEMNFIKFINMFIDKTEKNVYIIGGKRVFDDEQVITRLRNPKTIVTPVACVDKRTRFYEKWFPKLFTYRMNKKNLSLWENEDVVCLFDNI